MLLNDFKTTFLENILAFIWRQWSALGVAGGARVEDKWVIDPEALLIFSLDMARYEPRLFDEILDWLVANGKWMDSQRLRGIIKHKEEETRRLLSAAALYISKEVKSLKRKWEPLASLSKGESAFEQGSLFYTKDGKPHPEPRKESEDFSAYGFLREEFHLRGMSKPIPVAAPSNLRFLLRGLFGIGSRSECILYLLTHKGGHPAEIAKAIGITKMAVRDSLIDLAASGLILTRIKGKRMIEYWLSPGRWGKFIYGVDFSEERLPRWVNWITLFSAFKNVWNVLSEAAKTGSDYMRSSKLREAMVGLSREFSASGLDLPPLPGREIPPEDFEEAFQNFITGILGTSLRSGKDG